MYQQERSYIRVQNKPETYVFWFMDHFPCERVGSELVLAEAGILIKPQERQMICDCP